MLSHASRRFVFKLSGIRRGLVPWDRHTRLWQHETYHLSDRKYRHYQESQAYFGTIIHQGACYQKGIFLQIRWSNVNILDKCNLSKIEAMRSVNKVDQTSSFAVTGYPWSHHAHPSTLLPFDNQILLSSDHLGHWTQDMLDTGDDNDNEHQQLSLSNLLSFVLHTEDSVCCFESDRDLHISRLKSFTSTWLVFHSL